MDDDRLLARIGALLRQAEGTDNEHEAETFMQAAQRLATSASIDLAVARAHDPAARRKTTPITRQVAIGETGKRGLRTYVQLFVAIARANGVTVDVAGNNTFVLAYGYEADIDTCEALYTSLLIQMVAASGGEQQELGFRGPAVGAAIDQQLADFLGPGRAPGLAGQDDLAPLGAQGVGQHPGLGGLARPVDALEADEHRLPPS